jgi:uncharacterized protein YutE (UPF0331/DUF86 family)
MSPGVLDRRTLERRLEQLESYIGDVEQLGPITLDGLLNRTLHLALERALFLCTQAALDIAMQIVTARGRAAEGYADAIDQLVVLAILPRPFAEDFRKMAGFRNVLVHGYTNLSNPVLIEVATTKLSHFRMFITHVQANALA